MIAGLRPYPANKHSGVPWLGEVPERWGVTCPPVCWRGEQKANIIPTS